MFSSFLGTLQGSKVKKLRDPPYPYQEDQNTPSMTPKYRVDNWQIPVPIGDASAHFLLDMNTGQKGTVINAFFMDGGETSGKDSAWKMIVAALKAIDEAYGINWKFDSIVTTHHDSDHYMGLKELLGITTTLKRGQKRGTYRNVYFQKNVTFYSGSNDLTFNPDCANALPAVKGEYCIGVDLFSKTRMFQRAAGVDTDAEDFEHGIKVFDGDGDNFDRPRFAVVGANGFGVHPTSEAPITLTPTKNQTSILAVVYWPAENGRTSYFTGGDGNPKVESEGVVPWMTRNQKKNLKTLPKLPVHMVKLDHHGSLGEAITDNGIKLVKRDGINTIESLSTILNTMNPARVIVTPGNQHGHPNWAVMQHVREHFFKMNRMDRRGVGKLYTTRSPYWLSKGKPNGLDANPNHANDGKVKLVFTKHADYSDAFYPNKDEQKFALYSEELGPGDSRANHDSIFTASQESWTIVNELKKNEEAEFLIWSQTQSISTKLYKNGKLNRDMYNGWVGARLNDTVRQLDEFRKNPREHEDPATSNLYTANQEWRQIIKDIVWYGRLTWPDICEQNICDVGSPYWLVRFWFEADGLSGVMWEMDENGAKKVVGKAHEEVYIPVTRYGTNMGTAYMPLKINEEMTTDKYSKTNYNVNIEYDDNTTKMSNNIDTEGMGTLVEVLNYTIQGIHNMGLAKLFTKLNLVDPIVMNLNNEFNKYPKVDLSTFPVHNQLLPIDVAVNKLIGVEIPVDYQYLKAGKKSRQGETPKLADFRNFTVDDPTPGGRSKQFSGKLTELLDFRIFLEVYAGIVFKMPDRWKYKSREQQTRGMFIDAEESMIDQLRSRWIELIDHQLKTSSVQWRRLNTREFARLKRIQLKALDIDVDDFDGEFDEDYQPSGNNAKKKIPINQPSKKFHK